MRVALIGYGSVAAVHARGISEIGESAELVTVCGPDERKAETFAQLHNIPYADTKLQDALGRSDAAIVCSPSPLHFSQGSEALECGKNVLLELPACASSSEAEVLSTLAASSSVLLQCAHTSRYLEPYRRIGAWLGSSALGEIRHLHYIRFMLPRARSWTDDALLHHAQHPLDLFLHWFTAITPLGFTARPGLPGAQDISLVGSVDSKAPLTISISYSSRLPELKMTIVGARHTVVTDGFTYISSDDSNFNWQGDEQKVYETAIREQDAAFLAACRGKDVGIPWSETIRLTSCVREFANLWNRNCKSDL